MKRRTLFASFLALALTAGLATPALALDDLRIIAPAGPGGGWDQTARSLSEVMAAMGAKGGTVENVPGAGGFAGAGFMRTGREDNADPVVEYKRKRYDTPSRGFHSLNLLRHQAR